MWPSLAAEFRITLADGSVWLAIGQGLVAGAVCLSFGVWVARLVGLLRSDAPAGETLGVGLAAGLLVLAAWWAAVASGGRSSFTPVAVGFAIAIALAAAGRRRRGSEREAWGPSRVVPVTPPPQSARRRDLFVAVVGGGIFVVAVALLYGSTLVLSPRDGVQPLEFMDEAYYSVLGRDLAETGTETIYSPSGFDAIDGLPSQTWYHWGETWLAAAAITIFGADALDARHFIVLPLLLLASAALTGTLVRRVTASRSRGAYLFGFLACLFLAPLPVIQAGHFSSWATGLIFGITMYGLAAVAVLLAMFGLVVLSDRRSNWALAVFGGSATALILPAHIVIAVLGIIGVGSVSAIRMAESLMRRQVPSVSLIWRRTIVSAAVLLVATVAWGIFTGHGAVTSGQSPGVSAFNESWRDAVAIAAIGAGAFLAIAVGWLIARKSGSIEADLYLGTTVILITGALIWGARLAEINTFYLFYGGIAVFATPCAAIAVWSIWRWLRATNYRRLALVVLVVALVQVELGGGLGAARLYEFGPGAVSPVGVEILSAIRALPANAKFAYACLPTEASAFWAPRLLGLRAHTGRSVIPMCFEAEFFAKLLGVPSSSDVQSPQFRWAPQLALYPTSNARPSPERVAQFLRANGVDYIYADAMHPNALVPDAIPVAKAGGTEILQLP